MRTALALIAALLAVPLHAAISGVVLDPDGAPIDGALVTAHPPLNAYLLASGVLPDLDAPPLAHTTTDAKGEFSLDLPGRGIALLRIAREGHVPNAVAVAIDEPAGPIVLRRGEMVAGTVKAGGKPVEGATVIAVSRGGALAVARTDAAGKYRLPQPSAWADVLVARHPDLARMAHTAASLDFTLDAGTTVSGKVVDANGKPVAGAMVDVDRTARATTGEDGTFAVAHVGQQRMLIRALSSAGFVAARLAAGTPTLQLKPAGRLTGVVRNAEKQPLSGIAVIAIDGAGGHGDVAVTDAKGIFVFDALPRGTYSLQVEADSIYQSDEEVSVPLGEEAKRDLVAKKQPAVSGIVRRENGKPVTGAQVGLMTASGGAQNGEFDFAYLTPTVSAADGRFRVRAPDDSPMRIIAVAAGLPVGQSQPFVPGPRNKGEFVVTIPEGLPVAGVVVGPDEKPLGGVSINPLVGSAPSGIDDDQRVQPWARTDAEGRFAGRLAQGSVALSFEQPGFVGLQRVFDVAGGMEPIRVQLGLGAAIRGRVVTKDGTPVAEATVFTEEVHTTTQSDGRFELKNLAPGLHEVRVVMKSVTETQIITAPSDDVRLVIGATRTLAGRVTDATSGAPVQKFVLYPSGAEPSGMRMPQRFESPAGEFSMDVAESTKELMVMADGYAVAKGIAVDLSKKEPMVIALSRGRTIRGQIRNERGDPIAGAEISSSSVSMRYARPEMPRSSADGSYELTGIDDDALSLKVAAKGYVSAERAVRAGTEDEAIDFALKRGITVTGHVLGAGGSVANIPVTASSAAHGADSVTETTDESGAFRFDSLASARYSFEAADMESGRSGEVKDVDVEKVREVTIRLEQRSTATIIGRVNDIQPTELMRMVTASGEDGQMQSAAISMAGTFRIENAPTGLVEVEARVGTRGRMRTARPVTVEVAPGAEVRVELSFPPDVALHGRVTQGGEPLPGAQIHFSGRGADDYNAAAGSDGSYQVTLPAGEYEVTINSQGRGRLPFAQQISIAQAAEIDFRIDAASIPVMVVDAATSQPLGGVSVAASPRGQTHSVAQAETGADGSATLDVARGQEVTVVAARTGYANASADVTGGASSSVLLRMTPSVGATVRIIDARDGRTLTGYVIARDAAGRVVASANETDAEGTFTLPLAPGAYQFSASASDYGSHTVRGEVPSGEVRIPLPRGGKLALHAAENLRGTARLIQPNGEDYVRCWCSGIAEIRIEGRMTIVDQISPGSYTLEVTPAGGKPKRYPVTVVEGQTMRVELE